MKSSFVEPFISFTTKSQFTYGLLGEITYDWKAKAVTAPVSLNFNQLVKIGGQQLTVGGALRYYVGTNDMSAHGWGARVTINFLFPEKKP